MTEIWKDVVGYEGLYQVSNLGRVKSLPRESTKGKTLKNRIIKGYYTVHLSKFGVSKDKLVHILVAEAFIDNPNRLKYINHIDGNKLNNTVSNLEWCTASYNSLHAYATGLRTPNTTMLGKPSPRRTPVLCVDMGIEYPSATAASNMTGINHGHISDCCRGERKTAGGFKWVYIT